ncbi:hypothetical protein HYPSUDRAFT_209280 [Hypholoma sublateritium FD-334 SS-4]|uniref:DUF4219 domain-containing protein n=1 Tax=Hypholoma sublateritium (strain FD-334 SS-4) TaxID=945553 RepID=A0A0D2LSH0_HYPSF|nr:hypothetical protein HYPSUDRAFT_209280 [Hypholoma sublateritium FD-334 SS-4]
MSSNNIPNFTKLNASNYPTWSGEMQAYLRSQSVWRIVSGNSKQPNTSSTPSNTQAAALEAWQLKSDKAAGYIYLAMWAALASVHLQKRPGARFNVYDDLFSTPKVIWRYLGFYFDRKLLFNEHPKERRLLYRSCVVPIATYGFRLWFYNKAPIKGVMKLLTSMQHKAAIWITGAFKTSPTGGYRKGALEHPVALNRLSVRERPKLRGAIADTHSEILALTKTFAPCAPVARPGQRLLDLFPARTVFHLRSEYLEPEPGTLPDTEDVAAYHVWLYENVVEGTIKAHLDGIRDEAHAEPNTGDERVDSARYVSGKVLAPEAELSAIHFAVVRATQVPGCTRIVLFTDHIASAKKALDPSGDPFDHHFDRVVQTL